MDPLFCILGCNVYLGFVQQTAHLVDGMAAVAVLDWWLLLWIGGKRWMLCNHRIPTQQFVLESQRVGGFTCNGHKLSRLNELISNVTMQVSYIIWNAFAQYPI